MPVEHKRGQPAAAAIMQMTRMHLSPGWERASPDEWPQVDLAGWQGLTCGPQKGANLDVQLDGGIDEQLAQLATDIGVDDDLSPADLQASNSEAANADTQGTSSGAAASMTLDMFGSKFTQQITSVDNLKAQMETASNEVAVLDQQEDNSNAQDQPTTVQ